MTRNSLLLGLATLGLAACIAGPVWGQDFKRPDGSVPLVMDWSDQHVIYTVGFTREQGSKMQSDPRFYVQMLRHPALAKAAAAIGDPTVARPSATSTATASTATASATTGGNDSEGVILPAARKKSGTMSKDWSVPLGTGGVAAGMYPAKFVFNTNSTPSCTGDFVVYPINASTGNTRANAVATFSTSVGSPGGQALFITITPATGPNYILSMVSSLTVNTGTSFLVYSAASSTNASNEAANLAAAINRNLQSVALEGMVAIASSNTVTVYALTAGTGVALTVPANGVTGLSAFTITAGTNGASQQANIAALNYLYSNSPGSSYCVSNTDPEFIFSYASGVGPVATSPVISLPGTGVVYVENDPNIGAILHVLTFATGANEYGSACASSNAGTVAPTCASHPVIPGNGTSTATDYMLPLGALANGTTGTDTYSSPFLDYATNTAYVGDDNGYLYAIYPVFSGTPKLAGSPWPVTVHNGYKLSAPVVDVSLGNIFVGDSAGILYNYSAGGTQEATLTVGSSSHTSGALFDGPIIDSTNSVGYVVAGCNGTDSVLTQFPFTATSIGTARTASFNTEGCSANIPMHNPALNNNYYAEPTSGAARDVEACNSTSTGTYLLQFVLTSGSMATSAQYSDDQLDAHGGRTCAPVAEFAGYQEEVNPTSVTQSGTTVTVAPNSYPFLLGTVVTVSGIVAGTGGCTGTAASDLNGQFVITGVTGTTSFTYTSPVSATITAGQCNLLSAAAEAPTADILFYSTNQPDLYNFTAPLTASTQQPILGAAYTTGLGSGTSGMIIDNDGPLTDESNIYFGTLPAITNTNINLTGLVVDSGSTTYTATVSSTTGMPTSVTLANVLCSTGSGLPCSAGGSSLDPNGLYTIDIVNATTFTFNSTEYTGGGAITSLTVPYNSDVYTATTSGVATGLPTTGVTIAGVDCTAPGDLTPPCTGFASSENPNGSPTITVTGANTFTFTGATNNSTGMTLSALSVPFGSTTYTGTVSSNTNLPSSVTLAGVDCIGGTTGSCAGGPSTPNATENITLSGGTQFTFTGAADNGSAITSLTVPGGSSTYTATVASASELSTGNSVTLAGVACAGNTSAPCSGGPTTLPNGAQTVTGTTGTTFTFTGASNPGGGQTITALTVPYNSTTYTATVGSTAGLATNSTATISGVKCDDLTTAPCTSGSASLNPNAAQTVTGVTSTTFTFTGTRNTGGGGTIMGLTVPNASSTYTATVANTAGLVAGESVTITGVECENGGSAGTAPCTSGASSLNPNAAQTIVNVPNSTTFTFTGTENMGGNGITITGLTVPFNSSTYTATVASGGTNGLVNGSSVTIAGVKCASPGDTTPPCTTSGNSLNPNGGQTVLSVLSGTQFTFTSTENTAGVSGNITGLSVPNGSSTYTATVASTTGLANGDSVTIAGVTCAGGGGAPCTNGPTTLPNAAYTIGGLTSTSFTFTGPTNSSSAQTVTGLTVPNNSTTYTVTVSSTAGMIAGESVTIANIECSDHSGPPCTTSGNSLNPNGAQTVLSVLSGTQFTFMSTLNNSGSTYTFHAHFSSSATFGYNFGVAAPATYSYGSTYTFDPSSGTATFGYTFDPSTGSYSSIYAFDPSSGTATWPYTFYVTGATYGLTTYNFDLPSATVSWLYQFDVAGGSYSSIYAFDVAHPATAGWSTSGTSNAVKLTQSTLQ